MESKLQRSIKCCAEPCIVNDKSKERDKRIIDCSSPGCVKSFHVSCIGQAKTSDKDLQNLFFVCLRCESYLNYGAEIARKSFIKVLDDKLDSLKQSIYDTIDEKIRSEGEKLLQQSQLVSQSMAKEFDEKLDEVRKLATEANDFTLALIKENNEKVAKFQADFQTHPSRDSIETDELKVSVKTMQEKLNSLDLKKRKKSFIIKHFPEKPCSVKGKRISTCDEAVSAIAQVLGLESETKNIKDSYRLGKVRDNGTRPILVKSSEKTTRLFLSKSKLLKDADQPLNRVFIQEDLPATANKKLADMRKRAYDHRRNHPSEKAYVKNKKLYINDVVVDEVDQNF